MVSRGVVEIYMKNVSVEGVDAYVSNRLKPRAGVPTIKSAPPPSFVSARGGSVDLDAYISLFLFLCTGAFL